jgi:hypothetical protein
MSDPETVQESARRANSWKATHYIVSAVAGVVTLFLAVFTNVDESRQAWDNLLAGVSGEIVGATSLTTPATTPRGSPPAATTTGASETPPQTKPAVDTQLAAAPKPGLRLSAPQRRLPSGAPLAFTLSVERIGFFTLWNIDIDGKAQRIYPGVGIIPAPIEAGKDYVPGDLLPKMKVEGAPGREQLLVVWSSRPAPHARRSHYENLAELLTELKAQVRGERQMRRFQYELLPAARVDEF